MSDELKPIVAKKIIKEYKKGMKGMQAYMQQNTPIHIVEIVHTECVFAIYKWWNPYKRRWVFEGRKLTELLYWNSLVSDMTKEERAELFRLNGFDYEKVKGR